MPRKVSFYSKHASRTNYLTNKIPDALINQVCSFYLELSTEMEVKALKLSGTVFFISISKIESVLTINKTSSMLLVLQKIIQVKNISTKTANLTKKWCFYIRKGWPKKTPVK